MLITTISHSKLSRVIKRMRRRPGENSEGRCLAYLALLHCYQAITGTGGRQCRSGIPIGGMHEMGKDKTCPQRCLWYWRGITWRRGMYLSDGNLHIVVSNCISKQRIGFEGTYLSYTARHLCLVLHFKGATLLDQHGRQGSNRLGAPGTYTKTLQTKPLIVQQHLQNAPLINPGHTFYQPLLDSRFHIPV